MKLTFFPYLKVNNLQFLWRSKLVTFPLLHGVRRLQLEKKDIFSRKSVCYELKIFIIKMLSCSEKKYHKTTFQILWKKARCFKFCQEICMQNIKL